MLPFHMFCTKTVESCMILIITIAPLSLSLSLSELNIHDIILLSEQVHDHLWVSSFCLLRWLHDVHETRRSEGKEVCYPR